MKVLVLVVVLAVLDKVLSVMEDLVEKVVVSDDLADVVVFVSGDVEILTVVTTLEVVAEMTGVDDVTTTTTPEEVVVDGMFGILGVVEMVRVFVVLGCVTPGVVELVRVFNVLDCVGLDSDSVMETSGMGTSGVSGISGWSGWSGVIVTMDIVVDGAGVTVVGNRGEVVTSGIDVGMSSGTVV